MLSKPSVAEAKNNFIAAMESLSVTTVAREHPLKSMAIAAAAGAVARISCGRAARLFFQMLEFADFARRLMLKK